MPSEQLRETLAELQSELEATESVDAESKRHLEEVLREIQQVLEPESESDEPESLAERLREATHHFEDSHPTLYTLVGRVVDTLANLGI